MHFMLLMMMVSLAYLLRCGWSEVVTDVWQRRWYRALVIFLLPVLLLITSAIAIVWMGPYGQMVWWQEGWLSYGLATIFLGLAMGYGFYLAYRGLKLMRQIQTYPTLNLQGYTVRLLPGSTPYIAQVGFWQPELVITPELLTTLDKEHLAAVLAHEQAHDYYHDTLFFGGLGWLRQITAWLPQTEALWQELLILREMRADRWASQKTDPLLVAEALLLMVQNSSCFYRAIHTDWGIAFSQFVPGQRLNQRIDALFSHSELSSDRLGPWPWLSLLLALLPLLLVPFHH